MKPLVSSKNKGGAVRGPVALVPDLNSCKHSACFQDGIFSQANIAKRAILWLLPYDQLGVQLETQ